MATIVVKLPDDRTEYGTIQVEDDAGNVLAGPFPAYGKADNSRASNEGNPSRDPVRPYGDTPTGGYLLGAVEPTGAGTGFSEPTYGNAGAIRLIPNSGQALEAEHNGRSGLLIHGGSTNATGGLRPTYGCVRVGNDDMAKVVDAYLTAPGGSCSASQENVVVTGPGTPGAQAGVVDGNLDPPGGFGFPGGGGSLATRAPWQAVTRRSGRVLAVSRRWSSQPTTRAHESGGPSTVSPARRQAASPLSSSTTVRRTTLPGW